MKAKKDSQRNLVLSILTLITVIVWVGFEVYHAATKSNVKPEVRNLLAPVNPKLNTEILDQLKDKKQVPWEDIKNSSAVLILEEKEKETESGFNLETEATPAAEVIPSEEAITE